MRFSKSSHKDQISRRLDQQYLEAISVLRVYYNNTSGIKKSLDVLNWGRNKVTNYYYALTGKDITKPMEIVYKWKDENESWKTKRNVKRFQR